VLARVDAGTRRPSTGLLILKELLDHYLDGFDIDQALSAKTRHDYRVYAETYLRPWLGERKVRDITPEVVLTWQRKLLKEGGTKAGKPLAPNTIRLARSPLSGAFKLAVATGIVAVNPLINVPRPKARRSVARHWTPDQTREFLALMEGDRTYPIWAFLLGSGLRIGELVALRWANVDLTARLVRVVDFATYLGHDVVASVGKSQRRGAHGRPRPGHGPRAETASKLEAAERLAAPAYQDSDVVFTKPAGGPYHPQYLSRLLGRYSAEVGLPR